MRNSKDPGISFLKCLAFAALACVIPLTMTAANRRHFVVQQLRKKVIEIEKDRRLNVLRDVLTREEQRGEALQARLRETLERQIALQARLQQVDQELRPENIERMFVGVGLVRPEEARESVRRRLSVDKQGILAQLELLRQERARLQASLATADAAIQ